MTNFSIFLSRWPIFGLKFMNVFLKRRKQSFTFLPFHFAQGKLFSFTFSRSFVTFTFLLFTFTSFAQIAVNTTGAAPHASAAFDIDFTDKGLLIPRMTEAQKNAILAPATGLLIYQTDSSSGFYYFDGTAWVLLATGGSSQWEDAGIYKRVIGNDNVRAYETGQNRGFYSIVNAIGGIGVYSGGQSTGVYGFGGTYGIEGDASPIGVFGNHVAGTLAGHNETHCGVQARFQWGDLTNSPSLPCRALISSLEANATITTLSDNSSAIYANVNSNVTAGKIFGVLATNPVANDSAAAIAGISSAITNKTFGVFGKINSNTEGAGGVCGVLDSKNYGLLGTSINAGADSIGVFGTGGDYGMYGKATGGGFKNYGVYGEAVGNPSLNIGVYGKSVDPSSSWNIGVYGTADNAGLFSYGVYGSSNGYGVYAHGAGNGATGLYAESTGAGAASNTGIYCTAYHSTSWNYALHAQVSDSNAYAIYAENIGTSGSGKYCSMKVETSGGVGTDTCIGAIFTAHLGNVNYGILVDSGYVGIGTLTPKNRLDVCGNICIGNQLAGTNATRTLILENGIVPTTSPANAVQLYSEDQVGSAELRVRDEAGNITTLSPHNFSLIGKKSEPMAWSYYSKNEKLGMEINVDMLKAMRLIEEVSGQQIVMIKTINKNDKTKDNVKKTKSLPELWKIIEMQQKEIQELKKEMEDIKKQNISH